MRKFTAVILCLAMTACLAACGAASEAPAEKNVINVSTTDEFLAAIAPGASIKLAEGAYDLTRAKGFGGRNVSEYYCWTDLGDNGQYALQIEDVDDLSISGEGAVILTPNRWATVLTFRHCDNLSLDGLSIGHIVPAGACEGGVISLNNCDDTSVTGCDLYGCGTVGMEAYDCYNLTVTGTDIHHCSSSAFSLSSGKNMIISNCSIHECGSDGEARAWALFNVWNSKGVSIEGCSVTGNSSEYLFGGYCDPDGLAVSNISVTDNRFNSLFGCDGRVELNGFDFSGNTVNNWFNTCNASEVIIDGTIDLAEAGSYGADALEEYRSYYDPLPEGKAYVWQKVYDGYELVINGVQNFHIHGGEIITQPRYANVLFFSGCGNISVSGTKAGHSPENGECTGGVIYLYNCSDAVIDSCDLYGCGTYGVLTDSCSVVNLQNTYIHDCSYGAASFSSSYKVTCINTAIISCPSPAISIYDCAEFIWDDRYMDETCNFDPAFG